MRYYASSHPEEVAGLVLGEAFNTDVLPSDLEHPLGGRPATAKILYSTLHFGSARLIYPRFFSKLDIAKDKELFQKWLAFNCRTKDVLAVRDEYDAMYQWREIRDEMQHLGDMPVTVLSAKAGYAPYDWWLDAQKALGAIADEVKMVDVDCTHGIALQRPDVIAASIREMVDGIRVQHTSRNAGVPSEVAD